MILDVIKMTEIDNLKTIETTLLLLIKNDYIMLAKKKRGFGGREI